MSQLDFLRNVIRTLDSVGIPYMLSGSFGSTIHGEPRSTNDVDLVIAPSVEQLDQLVEELAVLYYVDRDTAREALRTESSFNVIDAAAGWKADLILRKSRSFSREEFSRRMRTSLADMDIAVVSPEDLILSKLERSKIGGSERQYLDALGVARVQRTNLDEEYLRRWAASLRVTDLLEKLLAEASEQG